MRAGEGLACPGGREDPEGGGRGGREGDGRVETEGGMAAGDADGEKTASPTENEGERATTERGERGGQFVWGLPSGAEGTANFAWGDRQFAGKSGLTTRRARAGHPRQKRDGESDRHTD